jgi:hypothetical protein
MRVSLKFFLHITKRQGATLNPVTILTNMALATMASGYYQNIATILLTITIRIDLRFSWQ